MRIWREWGVRNGREVKLWCADFTLLGQRHRPKEETKKELAETIDALRAHARAIRLGLPVETAPVTLSELVNARKADSEFKAKVTYKRGCTVLDDFCAYFPVDQLVTTLTSADITAYLRARHPNLQASGINGYLGFISAMFRQADMYFPVLEHWRPPRLPYAREPEGRERTLALAETKAIMAWLRAPVKRATVREARAKVADIFELALLSVMRQGEWRKRKWSEVDFETNQIKLTKTKTGKARVLFMSPPVRAILERRYAARNHSAYIFPGARKVHQPMCEFTIRKVLAHAAEKLQIPYGRKVEGGFTYHDTRHTAVSRLLLAGHDLATVADIAGHSKKTMTMRYSHATAESRQRALATLETFAAQPETEAQVAKISPSQNGQGDK